MGIFRTIVAISISLCLALAPVASPFAAPRESSMDKMAMDAGTGMEGMKCHKARDGGAESSCDCCDTKSACPDQVACMTKCGKSLSMDRLPVKVALVTSARYLAIAPGKPPNPGRTPPSPPPRS